MAQYPSWLLPVPLWHLLLDVKTKPIHKIIRFIATDSIKGLYFVTTVTMNKVCDCFDNVIKKLWFFIGLL